MSETPKQVNLVDQLRADINARVAFCFNQDVEALGEEDPKEIILGVDDRFMLGARNGEHDSYKAKQEITIQIIGRQLVDGDVGYLVGVFQEGDYSPVPVYIPVSSQNM